MKERIVVNGKTYELVEELTLDDCLPRGGYYINNLGEIVVGVSGDNRKYPIIYPTPETSEKVLIYGLLHSVAHKLNDGKKGKYAITQYHYGCEPKPAKVDYHTIGLPLFAEEELAEQAIRIFQASKFDLKKLFQ